MTIDGGGRGDTTNVQFANGPLPATFTVTDTGGSGTDTVNNVRHQRGGHGST